MKTSSALLSTAMMWTLLTRARGFSVVSLTTSKRCFASNPLFVSAVSDSAHDKSPPSRSSTAGLPLVLLKRNRQSKSFRDGNQLVFTGSIDKIVGPRPKMGSLVQVEVPVANAEMAQTQIVGWGVYNPTSMYSVRIMHHALLKTSLTQQLKLVVKEDDPSHVAISLVLTSKLRKALQTRQAMGWPSATTDTYRLVNGEGDGLSGLAVDIIGDQVAVIMSSAAWCEVHRSTIKDCLQQLLPDHYDVIWKTTPSRLKQDGYEVDKNKQAEEEEVSPEQQEKMVIGLENGLKYQSFPYQQKGQKTSVYCDQRENRWNLAQLCQDKRVLDLCCYHGGFSLNAAKHRASSVTGVDSSQDAIDTCFDNAKLNELTDTVNFVKADITNYMQSCEEKYDVVVLDPPKLAPSVSSLDKATRKYHSLNRDAIKLIADEGGLFMTCTCSAAMTQKDGGNFFLQMVHQAGLAAQREITLLRVHGAAPCHTQSPASFPAGNYLTVALFHVHPKQ